MQINNFYSYQALNNRPNFKSSIRSYKLDGVGQVGNYTWMFRDDISWFNLANYEKENFKNKDKVNIIQFGASDGSEAFTKIISLIESSPESAKKFFPIKAYDICHDMVEATKSGLINLDCEEQSKLYEKGIDINEYFERSNEVLRIRNDNRFYTAETYKINDLLKNNVVFEQGDMFELIRSIEDDSNTVILCRNCLGYFDSEKINRFIDIVGKRLKTNSLFVVGSLEQVQQPLLTRLSEKGFKEVIPNVFKKII